MSPYLNALCISLEKPYCTENINLFKHAFDIVLIMNICRLWWIQDVYCML